MIPSTWYSGKDKKYGNSKKVSSCQESEGRTECVGRAQRISQDRETAPCDTIMVDVSLYICPNLQNTH